MEVELLVNQKLIDLNACPPYRDHMGCFLSGTEIDQRAVCAYCWLNHLLESGHPDNKYAQLSRANMADI